MLFRTVTGDIIEINRYNFKNDKMYYEKIIEIKKQFVVKDQSSKLDYWTKSKEAKSKETFNNKNN